MRLTLALLIVPFLLSACCARSRCCERVTPGGSMQVVETPEVVMEPEVAPEPEWPTEAERQMRPDHAPTPYTAAQIQAGCPAGRTITFRVEVKDSPTFHQVIRFADTSDEGAILEITVKTLEGKVISGPTRTPRAPWRALQAHASFPAAATVVAEEVIEVGAGSYNSLLYTITRETADGPTPVDRLWFAKDLPGPPVLMRKGVGDEVVYTMELIKNEMPAK